MVLKNFIISFLLVFLGVSTFPNSANAHPVTYKDGKAFWTFSMPKRQDIRFNYTFKPKWAVGASYTRLDSKSGERHYAWMRVNHLLKRWNLDGAQANIYTSLGFGAVTKNNTNSWFIPAEIQADYETRRIYGAINQQSFLSQDGFSNHRTKVSVGVAPYIADYEDLHTWIIAHIMYQPSLTREFIIAPGLRFFYKNFFAEVGSSFKGDWFVTAMIHF
jgi:hypothetical protein